MRGVWNELKEMASEQAEFSGLLWQLTMRDLRLRYKQSVMGFGWAVFMPLVNTAIFTVIFTRVANVDVGMPYPLFAFCGLLTWNFTASALRFSAISLTTNVNLVTKVHFPREILPFSAVLVAFVDFVVGVVPLVGFMAYYGVAPSWALLALPAVIAVHVVFTSAVALLLAMGNLFFRDVKYIFEILLTVWMFATSVVYPATQVGGRLGDLLQLNPMTPIIEGYRSVLLLGQLPPASDFATTAVLSGVLLLFCWLGFHRAEFTFAENV